MCSSETTTPISQDAAADKSKKGKSSVKRHSESRPRPKDQLSALSAGAAVRAVLPTSSLDLIPAAKRRAETDLSAVPKAKKARVQSTSSKPPKLRKNAARPTKLEKNTPLKETTETCMDTTPCIICGKRYNEPPADSWICCPHCNGWYHTSCGAEDTDLCYFCQ